ncbi:MAG: AAA family ATPase [Terriglobales bacterium]
MAVKLTILAADDSERRHLEMAAAESSQAELVAPSLPIPVPFAAPSALLRHPPEAVLLSLPAAEAGAEAALAMVRWLRQNLGLGLVMVVGPLDPARRIVEAMRAGASEYLEAPLRSGALDEALARCRLRSQTAAPRGQLIAVASARGGAGATTLAVNLALALQTGRPREGASPVLLLDAAPLGHAAHYLNLKPQFTLHHLLSHAERLDPSLLESLLLRHSSGVELLAGPSEPLPLPSDRDADGWLDLLRQTHSLIVADLSTRYDALAAHLFEAAAHILLVSQTDTVSLWSAATRRQYFDPARRLPFELVLNRYNARPQAALDGLEALTHLPVRCRLDNAFAALHEAGESGEPLALRTSSAWARSVHELARSLLSTPEAPKLQGWRQFLRARPHQA